jgi:hypothetical protein
VVQSFFALGAVLKVLQHRSLVAAAPKALQTQNTPNGVARLRKRSAGFSTGSKERAFVANSHGNK